MTRLKVSAQVVSGQLVTKRRNSMKIKRIQPFLATIDGIEINNEMRFNVLEHILYLIEFELNANFTKQFVEDLDELIQNLLLASEFTYSDIERILRDCVLDAKSFDTLQFDIPYMENCTEHINHQLARIAYNKGA